MTDPFVVETSYGRLRGAEADGVLVFRGVPFARPPLGKLRFQPPERPEPWSGLRDATRFGPAAPQRAGMLGPVFRLGIGETSEDCLYLNVWTPGLDGARRPVFVWIHGGAFVIGAGSQTLYDGAVLARRGNAVVVTINYRLGALGFLRLRELSRGALQVTGNEGLLDQLAALEWVRDEIAAFGGDPGNVTLFGESAGAMSCAALLGTPRAQGLFHRAILQSGSANYVSPADVAARLAHALLAELGLGPDVVHALRELPVERLLAAQQRLFLGLALSPLRVRSMLSLNPRRVLWALFVAPFLARQLVREVRSYVGERLRRLFGSRRPPTVTPRQVLASLLSERRFQGMPFEPVVDGETLPRHPFDAVEAGFSRDVPVLLGTNLEEAKLFTFMDPEASSLSEEALIARCDDKIGAGYGRRAVEVYRAARAARGERVTPSELWFAIESDRTMRYPAMRLAELQRRHQARTYAYLFTWRSPFMGGVFGACHALELPFVFGTLEHPLLRGFAGTGPEARALAERVQDAWIAFARTGDPSHPGLGAWPAYDSARRATMILGRECSIEEAPREAERAFWGFWDGKA
jgi:para-nitrobenzyl esterase